jgi:hypothetical protein
MKINRTFSIPVKLALRLKAVRNQSALVSRAVYKYLDEKEEFSSSDIPSRSLLSAITNRDDVPEHIKVIIQLHLENK